MQLVQEREAGGACGCCTYLEPVGDVSRMGALPPAGRWHSAGQARHAERQRLQPGSVRELRPPVCEVEGLQPRSSCSGRRRGQQRRRRCQASFCVTHAEEAERKEASEGCHGAGLRGWKQQTRISQEPRQGDESPLTEIDSCTVQSSFPTESSRG